MASTWFLLHCSAHGRSTPVKIPGQDGIPALRRQMSLSALQSGVPRIYVHCSLAKPLLPRPVISAFEITIGLNLLSPVNVRPRAACSPNCSTLSTQMCTVPLRPGSTPSSPHPCWPGLSTPFPLHLGLPRPPDLSGANAHPSSSFSPLWKSAHSRGLPCSVFS